MTGIDTTRLRALAEAAHSDMAPEGSRDPKVWAAYLRTVGAFQKAIDPPTMLALLDEIERLRGEKSLLFRDDDGRIWETLPNGLLKLTEWDMTTTRTPHEVEEDYGPVAPWEPIEGDGDE